MKHLLTIIITIILLAGCDFSSTSTPPPSEPSPPASQTTSPPSSTMVEPTPTIQPTSTLPLPTQTFVPGPELPVLAGTPVPLPNEPITPENVDQIQELAIWGKGRIKQIVYSPDGKFLAVGTLAGVWLYDTETMVQLRFINSGNFIGSLVFTPDSQHLVADVGANRLVTWNVMTGEQLSSFQVRQAYQGNVVNSPGIATFSPDATRLAATTNDRTVEIWDVASGQLLQTLTGHKDAIKNLALSPDNRFLATASRDKTIWIWDILTGMHLQTLEGYERRSTSLAFAPILENHKSEILLAIGGPEGEIWLWDIHADALFRTLHLPSASLAGDLSFSSDGTMLAAEVSIPSSVPDTLSEKVIQIWQIPEGTLLYTLKGHTNGINSLTFSPDNKFLISGSVDGTVRIWDIETEVLVKTITGFERNDWGLALHTPPLPAFSAGNTLFVTNPFDFNIDLWDLDTGNKVNTLSGHTSNLTDFAISADGSTLVSAEFWDYIIRIWDANTNEALGIYEVYADTGYGKSLAISPNGQLVAVGDSRVWGRVYDTQTGKNLYTLSGGGELGIRHLAFSPDGSKLAFGSDEQNLTILEAETGQVLHDLKVGPFAISLAFSPDGNTLAIGTHKDTIELWDVSRGELIRTLKEDDRRIITLTFSPDGQILAAGMSDQRSQIGSLTSTIQLWDIETGLLLPTSIKYAANIQQLTFSPNGKFLASSSLDGSLRLWGVLPN